MAAISCVNFTAKVSSVLGRDVKAYGKKYMFDDADDTCWNSDQGTPQWVEVSFAHPTTLCKFLIQFQGGFAARTIQLQVGDETAAVFHPLDVNSVQTFSLPQPQSVERVKFYFPESTDTYGRIIIYKLVMFENDS